MAAVWKLPVLFLCENNFWGFSTPIHKEMAVENIADRASGLGLPGEIVDGNDVIAVYKVTLKAIQRAREGNGPTLIEGKMHRWLGHHEKDTDFYRSDQEREEAKRNCPINRLRERMLKDKLVEASQISSIDQEIDEEIREAVIFANASPAPGPKELHFLDSYYI